VPGEQLSPDVQAFYVLSGPNLQKWALDGDTEHVSASSHGQFAIKHIPLRLMHDELIKSYAAIC